MYGLGNMTLFLLMVNYLAALVAVQLLRGDYSADEAINFGEIYNAFLGVYQVFSSEDWQSILYGATSVEGGLGQTVIVAIFFAGWLLFSNCAYIPQVLLFLSSPLIRMTMRQLLSL